MSYALEQRAFIGLAGVDDRLARRTGIEPQVGFALGLIRPMTLETVVGKNRADVAVEIDTILPGSSRGFGLQDTNRQEEAGAQQVQVP